MHPEVCETFGLGERRVCLAELNLEKMLATAGTPVQITTDPGLDVHPSWSPDGKRLAFSDKDGKLYVLTIDDKSVIEVADEKRGSLRDYAWSPHAGHLACSLADPSGNRR